MDNAKDDLVYKTAQLSTCSQIFLGILSTIGFIHIPDSNDTNVLFILLITDVIVQIIELIFYVIFIIVGRLDTYYRYFDWFLTTPIMLINSMLFLEYLNDKYITVTEFTTEFKNEIIFVILMNSVMLAFGFSAELRWIPPKISIVLGWFPFIAVFSLIYAKNAYKTVEGLILFTFITIIWGLYGIAAFMEQYKKNIFYNILDIISKNLYGVIVAFYMISL